MKQLQKADSVQDSDNLMLDTDGYAKRVDVKLLGKYATRDFQALRIEVNHELLNFENTLLKVINLTEVNAIISLLSFHSLEDRLAKRTLKLFSSCRCDKYAPVCTCGGKMLEIVNKKPICATEEEIKINPPSRSAKLRIAKRI